MPGSTNFLPWGGNTGPSSNIENDSQYNSDATRQGGAVVNQAFPSNLSNKLFLQVTMMVAALGQMMSTKGYVVSDANLNNLAAALANIVTQFDLGNSPALGGNPTSPTQATVDNSTKIATTAFIKNVLASSPALGGNPTATTQPTSDNSNNIATTSFVQQLIAFVEGLLPTIVGISGGIRFGPLYFQVGTNNVGAGGTVINFPTAFPNACLITIACPAGSAPTTVGVITFNRFFWQGVGPAGVVACNWLAIGF